MSKPLKVLHYDMETTPMDVWAWRPGQDWIPHEATKRDYWFLSWAAKWAGKGFVYSDVVSPEEARNWDDARITASIHALVGEADVLVAHNGDSFDWPKLNGRFLLHGLDPIQPPRTIDTLKLARKNFGFAYNKLDYLAHIMGLGNKIKTEFEWWTSAMEGDAATLAKMVKYNRHDVVLLEKVFDKMKPYVRNLPRLVDAERELEHACPSCGSGDLQKRGFHRTNASTFQTWKCNRCARYSRTNSSNRNQKLKLHPL